MKNKLQDIAFRIQIDPVNTAQHAAKAISLLTVLENIIKSYNNFVEIEFLKNPEYAKTYAQDKSQLDKVKADLDLLVVGLEFGSAELAFSPAFEEKPEIFPNTTDKWEKKTFKGFKNNVLCAEYDDPNFAKRIKKRYTDRERLSIYQPYFDCLDDTGSYKLNITDKKHKVLKTIWKPDKQFLDIYTPNVKSRKIESDYSYAKIYAKIKKGGKGKKDIKEILSFEESLYEIYPYKPDMIRYDRNIFILDHKLDCEVCYDEGNYIITNDEFDITVWGHTREEAENAFAFTFSALYKNYCEESDDNLSDKAKNLKYKLKLIIKDTVKQ